MPISATYPSDARYEKHMNIIMMYTCNPCCAEISYDLNSLLLAQCANFTHAITLISTIRSCQELNNCTVVK